MTHTAALRPAPKTLSPKQQQVFDFLTAEKAGGRPFPWMPAIARHMGWAHTSSARDCLDMMANKGAIARIPTATGWRFDMLAEEPVP